jgi:hypothetical protein
MGSHQTALKISLELLIYRKNEAVPTDFFKF